MEGAALAIKKKVYDNRIVTFAPLYLSNACVNNCVYCGFRHDNTTMKRSILSQDDVRKEVEVLAGTIGHNTRCLTPTTLPKHCVPFTVYKLKQKTATRPSAA